MTDAEPKPRLPGVGEYVRMTGTLVKVEDVTPKEVVLDYIFEDTEAKVEIWNGKYLLEKLSTFNNFYGKDSCVDAAIKLAKETARKLKNPGLDVRVIKRTSQFRARPTYGKNYHAPEFPVMEGLKFGCRADLPDDKEEIVWSSMKAQKKSKKAKR
jgi:hypothetical protein